MSNLSTIPRPRHDDAADVAHLVAAAQSGDRDAFSELYRMYSGAVMRAILPRVDYDHYLAEDLTQQAFLAAWEWIGRTQFRSANARSWLVAIGRNCTRYYWSRLRPTDRASYKDDLDRLTDNAEVPASEVDRASAARDAVVRRHIEALQGARQRQCLQLRFYEGLTQNQTAAAMGVHKSTVQEFEHTAVRHLKRQLASELYGVV